VSIALSLAILAVSVAALLGVIALVRHFGRRHGWPAEVQRKSVHVAIGLYALALPLLFDARWPVVALLLIALALMLVLRTPASRTTGLGAAIHSVERRSAGDIWLALAIGFVFLRAGQSYILFALPIAVIALSDAAAALTGSSYGRRRFAVEDGVKSWEGVIAFFAVTWILAMVMLLLLTDVPRLNVVVLAVTIAAFGAVVEAVSWRGLDNLFVPVCVHFFLAGYLNADPQTLVLLAGVFLIAVLAIALLSPRLGLSVHASRAFVIAIFLFIGVGGLYGTVLPVLVIAMHLVARRHAPCRSDYGDLDCIATLCAIGLIWFFIGGSIGPNALNLYNLTLAGMVLGYAIIALRCDWRWAVPAFAVAFGLYLALVEFGPARARWVAWLPWIAAGSLALVTVALLARRGWADRWRAPRLAAVATIVPMTAYLVQAVKL
jgi:phytol kinase